MNQTRTGFQLKNMGKQAMAGSNKQNKTRKVVHRAKRGGSWLWIGVILGSITLIVGVLLYVYFMSNANDVVAFDPAVFHIG